MNDELATAVNDLSALARAAFYTEHADDWMERAHSLAQVIVGFLPLPDRDVADQVITAAKLLDHLGAKQAVNVLLTTGMRDGGPHADRFARACAAIYARDDDWELAELAFLHAWHDAPSDVVSAANLALCSVYGTLTESVAETVRQAGPVEPVSPTMRFTLLAATFDDTMSTGRFALARTVLQRLEDCAAEVLDELGDDDPYLAFVLLIVASARCGAYAADGDVTALRGSADVLGVAVQRVSGVLGSDHAHTLSGLANLVNAEFALALATRPTSDLARSVADLRAARVKTIAALGPLHRLSVRASMNAAGAELELARQQGSVHSMELAGVELRRAATLANRSFGPFHPLAAIAASNAATAEFDIARHRQATDDLERLVAVFEQTVLQAEQSLGPAHAVSGVLASQLRACRRMLAGGPPGPAIEGGSGVATLVQTVTEQSWGVGGDYVSVFQADQVTSHVAVNDVGTPEDFLAAIDKAIKYFNDGDIVEGKVVLVGEEEVLVDIGYKTEGVVSAGELSIRGDVEPSDVVSVGDDVEALVLQKSDREGRLILSILRAGYERAWVTLEALKDRGEPVRGTVIKVVKGGLILDVGLRGFLPASLVEMRRVRDLQPYLGHDLDALILELDKARNTVVLSRRAWLEQTQAEVRREFLEGLRKGQVRKGVVSSIVNFGAFVDLGGVDGLVHVSELSWTHIDHPREVVEVGQEITVEVTDVDLERDRVSLSLRATQEDPWRRFAREHGIGQFVRGIVTTLVPFGVFVRVAEGIEGLVHISQLAERRVEIPAQAVSSGDEVVVQIIDIDLAQRRISLSVKAADAVPLGTEFDPALYGMAAEYDDEGNYIYPKGFDPDTNEWRDGYQRQREEWERRYAETRACYEQHMKQILKASQRARGDNTASVDVGSGGGPLAEVEHLDLRDGQRPEREDQADHDAPLT